VRAKLARRGLGGGSRGTFKSPARWAAGVTPAPGVPAPDPAQNPADGILLSPCLKDSFSKICAAHIFGMDHWVQGSPLPPTAQVI
jgi:hypothetical protein